MADDTKVTKCKSCGADVIWLTMVKQNGEEVAHIFDAKPIGWAWVRFGPGGKKAKRCDTYISHWATCPSAHLHRGEK